MFSVSKGGDIYGSIIEIAIFADKWLLIGDFIQFNII